MTLGIFSHVLPDMQRDAVQAMDRVLQDPEANEQASEEKTANRTGTQGDERRERGGGM
jgi:hypothetical protein